MANTRILAWAGALLVAFVTCSGCGGSSGPAVYSVTGKVTKGGQPLKNVNVTFVPMDDKALTSAGNLNDSGEYILYATDGREGAVAGKYKVVLRPAQNLTLEQMQELQKQMGPNNPGGKPTLPVAPFDKKYTESSTTTLEAEVTASGPNEFNFTVE